MMILGVAREVDGRIFDPSFTRLSKLTFMQADGGFFTAD